MPELPEVERVRRSLVPHLVGRQVLAAKLHRADICESFTRTAKGVVRIKTTPGALLNGDAIKSLERRGKQLAFLGTSGKVLVAHLGMSGQLLWKKSGDEVRGGHVHAEWSIGTKARPKGRLLFRDPRRFGGLWTFDSFDSLLEARWSLLGPDALSVTPDQLCEGLGRSKRAIKAALLDQGVIAGVGNIYADEALFIAGIRPTRLVSRLKAAEVDLLTSAIREVLRRSIETGGSTLRDYVDADGSRGTAQDGHAVYGRGGETCRRCGGTLREAQVGQRTTVWCTHCQK